MSFRRFVADVYAPHVHFLFAAAWVLSLLGTFFTSEAKGQTWIFDLKLMACVATVFVTLFFLRAVDEWKDYDYDKIYKPEKPLVQGVVTHRQLFAYMTGSSVLALGLSAWLSWKIAVIVAVDMAWGLFLVLLEKISPFLRDNVFINLMVTYPVNIALSVCVYVFFLEQTGVAASPYAVLVIAGYAFAFLTYEFLRKAVWPHLAERDERTYSTVVGGKGAIALCLGTSAIGCALVVFVLLHRTQCGWTAFWAVGSMVAPVGAALRFMRVRNQRAKLAPYGTLFLLLFYGSLFIQALMANQVTWQLS